MKYAILNAEKALIWRIVHIDNVPWILDNGFHCGNSPFRSPTWVDIGNPDLISKRSLHPVPASPHGCLGDYVPFYFTPFSVMLMNIKSGWNGVVRRSNDEIVIFVSSLHKIQTKSIPFLFTDRHAFARYAKFFDDLGDLDKVDWDILQRRDFKRDPDDPEKFERYQAEALIHDHCPVGALSGVICHSTSAKAILDREIQKRKLDLPVRVKPEWYF